MSIGGDPVQELLDTARRAARRAGDLQRERFGDPGVIRSKHPMELVTEVDVACEDAIREIIGAEYPDHDFLGEESGESGSGSPHRWIVDPLDGTTNFARGLPIFASSVAYAHQGEVQVAACVIPLWGEEIWAVRGGGAFCNGRRLCVSDTASLDRAFVATGFPYDVKERSDNGLAQFERMVMSTLAVRRPGAAVVDLSCLAAGRFDGFWELRLKPWDTAAAGLLVTEAGGRITTYDGAPWDPSSPNILASNGHLHRAMMDVLADRG
jgi:myo-inositol-1(or 4)-monophosphatase